jgi:NADH-quinone oxidoreductase subunit E
MTTTDENATADTEAPASGPRGLTERTRTELVALTQRYPVARAALLPMLHLVQSHEGYVSSDGVGLCAEVLGLTKAEVGAVATFYTMYKREPVGDYLLSVCTNPTCKIAGGQRIFDGWVDKLGGAHTSSEGAGVMVEHAECLGICDAAPVVQINYEMYGPMTVDEGLGMLDQATSGSPPVSNRSGETPEVFTAVERELSGIDDGVHEHLVDAARAQAAAATPPSWRSGETDIPVTHPGGDPAGHGGQAFAEAARLDGSTPDKQATDAHRTDQPIGGEAPAHVAEEAEAESAYGDEVPDTGDGPAAPADAAVGAEGTMDDEAANASTPAPSAQPADDTGPPDSGPGHEADAEPTGHDADDDEGAR